MEYNTENHNDSMMGVIFTNITAISKLSFLKVEKYEYDTEHVCDFREYPRPHTCMGLILEGQGTFSSEGEEDILVRPGDIIYVPITTRYASYWKGEPKVSYISMHFIFESPLLTAQQRNFRLQKLSLPDFPALKNAFEQALTAYQGDEDQQLLALGIFFWTISRVFPLLRVRENGKRDQRIERAVEYLEQHCEEPVSINRLAEISNMSVSHFHSCFKRSVSMTPIEYKNRVCIERAMRLLKTDETRSIEEISGLLGFGSAEYFRRIFKRMTGMSPRVYRQTPLDL